ncbi:MAG: alpha/beta fold hydrolase [Alphaproteobacteria bacterium]|nr:alpha/beta fold hydrolase [Alphaproteobacteria bacterium]
MATATAKIRGLNINYEIVGDDGPWVALITGGRRGYGELVPLAKKIAAEGFRVLLHDRRNTGKSDMLLDDAEVEEIVWADDLRALLGRLDAVPAFVGGSSSGARTAMLFCLRHPEATRALLLLRVTGGEFAANRLPENYYGQFIRAAKEGGMAAVCATEAIQERIGENPASREVLMAMDPARYIDIQENLLALFVAGADLPVMGVTPEQLGSIRAPTVVIPGNDNTHSRESGLTAHKMIPGAELHELPISHQDVPLIPFPDWAEHEPEICRTFVDFMRRVEAAGG